VDLLAGMSLDLSDQPEEALKKFEKADVEGSNRDLVERAAKLNAAEGTGAESLETFAPWLRLISKGGQGVILARKNVPLARARIADALEIARLFLLEESGGTGNKLFELQSQQLTEAIGDGLMVLLTDKASDKDKRDAEARMRKSISLLNLHIIGAGRVREYSRYMVLMEVVLKDAAWWDDVTHGKKGPLVGKLLDSATGKLNTLYLDWIGNIRTEQMKRLLEIILALQAFLKDVPQLGTEWEGMDALLARSTPGLRSEIRKLGKALHAIFPEAEIHRLISQDDDPQGLVLDFVLSTLDIIETQLRTNQKIDVNSFKSGLIRHGKSRLSQITSEKSDNAGVIAIELGDDIGSANWSEAVEVLEQGRAKAGKSKFGELPYIWDLLEFGPLIQSGRLEQAEQALDRAANTCPDIAWELELGRMQLALSRGRLGEAYAALDRYAEGSANFHRSFLWLSTAIKSEWPFIRFSYKKSHSVTGAMLDPEEGRGEIEAVVETDEFDTEEEKSTSSKSLSVAVEQGGSPAHAAQTALLLKAWLALRAGDDQTAGKILADLQIAQWEYQSDVEVLAEEDSTRIYSRSGNFGRKLYEPRLGMWVATLAELRGHRRLAHDLMKLVQESVDTATEKGPPAPSKSHFAPYAWFSSTCDSQSDLSEDTPGLLKMIVCDPPMLEWQKQLAPYRKVVILRTMQLAGQSVPNTEWVTSLRALSASDPVGVPLWAIELDHAWRSGDVNLIPADAGGAGLMARAELGGADVLPVARLQGMACEAAMLEIQKNNSPGAKAVELAKMCSSGTVIAKVFHQTKPEDFADLAHRISWLMDWEKKIASGIGRGRQLKNIESDALALWVAKTSRTLKFGGAHFAESARALAKDAGERSWYRVAMALRIDAIAAELVNSQPPGETPEAILDDYYRWKLGKSRYSLFLKRLAYRSQTPADETSFARQFLAESQ